MRRHTVLIEFANGVGPGYHEGMQVLGGDVVAVQFSDALAELERANELKDELLEALQEILPFIPASSAKDGGPCAHSGNVIAADKVRAAIAAATGETK